MTSRIVKVSILFLLGALVTYIFLLNPESAEVSLPVGGSFKAPMALVLLAAFSAGFFVMFLFSMLFSIRQQLQVRKIKKQAEMVRNHQALITSAREQLALGNFSKAKGFFQKVVDRDPEDVTARVLLSECFQREGDAKAALRILEDARVEQKQNVELLLQAADLNKELGNHTAAFDNAALVLKLQPQSLSALERVSVEAAELGDYEKAISFTKERIKLTPYGEDESLQEYLATLELAQITKNSEQNEQMQAEIKKLLKSHRNFAPALAALADIEKETLELDEASRLLSMAYAASRDTEYLKQIAAMWLEAENPNRAIDSVKAALVLKDRDQKSDVLGQLYLVKLLLHLEANAEARNEFTQVDENMLADEEQRLMHALIHARILQKDGKHDEAFASVFTVVESPEALPGKGIFKQGGRHSVDNDHRWRTKMKEKLRSRKQPSPRLSTP